MKRLCSLVLAIALLATMFAPFAAARAAGFKDVAASYWAFDEIAALAAKKIIGGYTDGTFRPEGKVTREEFAKMIVVAKNLALVKPARPTFTDVSMTRRQLAHTPCLTLPMLSVLQPSFWSGTSSATSTRSALPRARSALMASTCHSSRPNRAAT